MRGTGRAVNNFEPPTEAGHWTRGLSSSDQNMSSLLVSGCIPLLVDSRVEVLGNGKATGCLAYWLSRGILAVVVCS